MLNEEVVKKLIKKKIKISFAESCTGGMLSKSITSISGSSKIFQLGLVTYSNYSKINILKIPKKSIKKYGAVSKNVCFIMAKNVSKISKTNMSASITGIAGPSGGTKNKPVGLVFIGIKRGNKININRFLFKNKGRKFIQKSAVNKCLKLILSAIK
tara:strand:- start:1094 stop:1561 length:468 start_codon:yes stop_codon:yes gene_type:complete